MASGVVVDVVEVVVEVVVVVEDDVAGVVVVVLIVVLGVVDVDTGSSPGQRQGDCEHVHGA